MVWLSKRQHSFNTFYRSDSLLLLLLFVKCTMILSSLQEWHNTESRFAFTQWTKGNWSWQLINRSVSVSAIFNVVMDKESWRLNMLRPHIRIPILCYRKRLVTAANRTDAWAECLYFVLRWSRTGRRRHWFCLPWHGQLQQKSSLKLKCKCHFWFNKLNKSKNSFASHLLMWSKKYISSFVSCCFVCWWMLIIKQLPRC